MRQSRLRAAGLGHHDLIELTVACARRTRGREQVELPHQVELAIVAVRDLAVRAIEVLPPRHQRRVVVGADVVEVLEHEEALHRAADLRERRGDRVREDVLLDERRAVAQALVVRDRVDERDAVGREAAIDRSRIIVAVILRADVLHHADRHDAIERAAATSR